MGAGQDTGPSYGEGRSWLLIKHRDDWAGPDRYRRVCALSVKSGGDLADILASDTPAIWTSNRPAKGGATGEMLAEIIEKAAAKKGRERTGKRKNEKGKRKRARVPAESGTKRANRRRILYSFFLFPLSLQKLYPAPATA